jgi:hypothetical protein
MKRVEGMVVMVVETVVVVGGKAEEPIVELPLKKILQMRI